MNAVERKREPRPHRELVNQSELMTWLGIWQRPKLEAWLKENNVPFYHAPGGVICTTAEAINEGLRVASHRVRARAAAGLDFKR